MAESFLKKKKGGIPVWGWGAGVAGAIVVGLYLRSRSAGTTAPAATAQTTDPNALATDPGIASGGGTAGGGLSESDLSALQSTLTDTLSAMELGGAFVPPIDPSVNEPGGRSSAPTIPVFHERSPVKSTGSRTAQKPKVNKAPGRMPTRKPARYYTYRKQVHLGPGQTLHFASGRGYYAA